MNLVDKYIFKQLLTNSLLILVLITSVFCLGKSVQLIELMVSRGLPASVFFKLIFNSLPQIIPTLLPIITGLSIFFVYSRMQTDREMVILQSSGFSNADLIRPVLGFGIILALLSFFFSIYQAPLSNKNFKILLYTIKNDYSSTLLQEGMFNTIGKDFTIFIKQNNKDGLHNIFIHDTRDEKKPTTLIAKKGNIINTDSATKIFLRDGSQQFQSEDKKLSILYFDEYLLNINQQSNNNFLTRWKSPSERTLNELISPDKDSLDDINNLQAFKAEVTLRFAMPINVLTFSIFLLSFILNLKFDRIENISRTIKILSIIVILQVLSILSSNISIKFENMHYVNFFPSIFTIILSMFFLFKSRKLIYD
ncbi:MAG: hypothetical protein CL572_02150 [Alphaproteobacteria bacterium]|nr:hypothetical protein [Alphaproteobacteria bacterium]